MTVAWCNTVMRGEKIALPLLECKSRFSMLTSGLPWTLGNPVFKRIALITNGRARAIGETLATVVRYLNKRYRGRAG